MTKSKIIDIIYWCVVSTMLFWIFCIVMDGCRSTDASISNNLSGRALPSSSSYLRPDTGGSNPRRTPKQLPPTFEIEMNVSAYCACKKCCEKWADGITASGKPAKGCFVAAPSRYPFGTMISIPGYNEGKPVPVLDRGGAIKGNKLDVFFGFDPNSSCTPHEKAIQWGRQYLKVRIKQ